MLEEICAKTFPDLQPVQTYVTFQRQAKSLAAPFPQTVTVEQGVLWDTALVAVTNSPRSTCTPTTGNPVMKITLEDSGRTFYAWSSFFLFLIEAASHVCKTYYKHVFSKTN